MPEGVPLPDDLRLFWQLCGGVELFVSAVVEPWDVAVVDQFRPTDEQLYPAGSGLRPAPHMYVIANAGRARNAPVSVDVRPERLGRCYDSFWDVHASPGNQRVVALSFTELLSDLMSARGDRPWWMDEDRYGDAWDGEPDQG